MRIILILGTVVNTKIVGLLTFISHVELMTLPERCYLDIKFSTFSLVAA
jgi:hypothetical protein